MWNLFLFCRWIKFASTNDANFDRIIHTVRFLMNTFTRNIWQERRTTMNSAYYWTSHTDKIWVIKIIKIYFSIFQLQSALYHNTQGYIVDYQAMFAREGISGTSSEKGILVLKSMYFSFQYPSHYWKSGVLGSLRPPVASGGTFIAGLYNKQISSFIFFII